MAASILCHIHLSYWLELSFRIKYSFTLESPPKCLHQIIRKIKLKSNEKTPENWKCRELKSFIIDSYFVIQIACVAPPIPLSVSSVVGVVRVFTCGRDRIWRQRNRRTGSAHIQCWNHFGSFSFYSECMSVVSFFCIAHSKREAHFFPRDEYAQRKTKNNENSQCGCVCVCARAVFTLLIIESIWFFGWFFCHYTRCACVCKNAKLIYDAQEAIFHSFISGPLLASVFQRVFFICLCIIRAIAS